MKKTVAFCTLGCKVNQYETDAMRGSFEAEGYEVKEFSQEASVYVINTCTVTNMADRKSRQMMHRAKKKNPDGIIVAVAATIIATIITPTIKCFFSFFPDINFTSFLTVI